MLVAALAVAAVALADSMSYVVLNHGRPAGAMTVVDDGDSAVVQYHYQDRQRGPRLETRYRFGADGGVRAIDARGLGSGAPATPVSERFEIRGDSVHWKSAIDSGRAPAASSPHYLLRTTTPYDDALLARALSRRPSRTMSLLPAGTARLSDVIDTTVTAGGTSRHLRMMVVDGMGPSPSAVWLDDRDRLFASDAGWFITVARGAEPFLPPLRAIERAWRGRRSEALARRLTPATKGALVIRDGDVFDSERGVVRPRTTIVIDGDRIVAVGPADSVHVPRGARTIDATGKTVLPGLWDMHTHLFQTAEENGVMQLAAGITTVRDMASDIDAAVSQRARAQAGTMLAPRTILAGFIEGPGRWAGPTEVIAHDEEEARAWVARYDSLGYRQIKLYNLVHPDIVPAIAEAAHARSMRLSGHIPRGLSLRAAVELGFDEFQHAAFLFSTFFQDSLYAPRMRAYSSVAAAVAPTFDVDGADMTALIAFLRAHGTVVDGTFNLYEDRSRPLADGGDPVFGPTLAWLPPIMRRQVAPDAAKSPADQAAALAATARYHRVLKRLFDAGVTLVPGTDNVAGLTYHGELEIYERAGIPAPAVLQIATIVPARVMHDDADYGSIASGKVADLVIVNGRPAAHITDLRRTERVIRAGRVYRAADLYAAVGITPSEMRIAPSASTATSTGRPK
jgi:imidazolonepropionase-like amidohydrolase